MLLDERLGNDCCGLSPSLSIVVAICGSVSQGSVYRCSWAAWRGWNRWWCDSRPLRLEWIGTRCCTWGLVGQALRLHSGLITRLLICFVVAHVAQINNVYYVKIICRLILWNCSVGQNLFQRKHFLLALIIQGSLLDLLGHLSYMWLLHVSIVWLNYFSLRNLLDDWLFLIVGLDQVLLLIGNVKLRTRGWHRLYHGSVPLLPHYVLDIHLDLSPLILHPYSSLGGCPSRSSRRFLCVQG